MTTIQGGLTVHKRTPLHSVTTGSDELSLVHAEATYFGDISGPAHETFVILKHADGSVTHYGWGFFTGSVLGVAGSLLWKFQGIPGSGDIEVYGGSGGTAALRGAIRYFLADDSGDKFTIEGDLE